MEAALAASTFVVDETYTTHSVHQGYLETQASIADAEPGGRIRLWCTNKPPYGLRKLIADCLDIDPELIEIQPAPIGGDFGGKGSPGDCPGLCRAVAADRPTGQERPSVPRGTDCDQSVPPAKIRIRIGGDAEGRITALWIGGNRQRGFVCRSQRERTWDALRPDVASGLPHSRRVHPSPLAAYTNTNREATCAPRGRLRAYLPWNLLSMSSHTR